MQYLANLDLKKNELQNALVHKLSSAPTSPVEGQIYYDTVNHALYWYSNIAWINALDRANHTGLQAQSTITNLVSDLAAKAALASPALTGTPLAPTASAGTNTTQIATTAFTIAEIAARLASNDAMIYKGAVDCSANPNYPAADAGWTYRVSVAGKIGGASGLVVEVGDMFICHVDSSTSGNQATVGANWDVLQTNVDGAVTLTGTQTLTNKTLTSPVINTPTGIVKGDVGLGNVANSLQLVAANNLSDLGNAATARTNLGVAIGTNVQAWDTDLDTWATKTAPSGVAVGTTDTQTLTNKTLTSPVINVGSDATGDLHYRNSGGLFTRLPVGSNTNVLTLAGGIPSWAAPASGVLRYSADVGDGSSVAIVVTHSLGTKDLTWSLRDNTTPFASLICDIEFTTTTTVTLRFAVAPTTNQYRITLLG